VSGLLGVGGGVVLVPGFMAALAMTQKEAIANSLLAIIPIAVVGAFVYYAGTGEHHVRLDLALAIAAGSVIGAAAGARLAHRVSDRSLRIAFGILLVLVAIRLLIPGGS
jgi:uncharacterized membrane protein YfcA